jgi:branched-chain amino acid transport system ATP-binding protein
VPVLTADGVSVRYGGLQALTDVSLTVAPGEAIGIIGPNGAGKSTFLEVLSGFRKPTAGRISLGGRVLPAGRAHRFARAGVVRAWQATRLFPRLTVVENLLVARLGRPEGSRGPVSYRAALREYPPEEVAEGLAFLDRFGLADRTSACASELSGGQRRLLEIARTLWLRPAAVLLDEPSVGVAPAMRAVLVEALQEELRAGRMALVVVEHELELIGRLCPTIQVLINGRVVARGSLESVMREDVVRRGYLGAKG